MIGNVAAYQFPERGRAVIVGALLLALGLAVALIPTHTPAHCPDGG